MTGEHICRKICTTPDGEPVFVRARVWGSPSWLTTAHTAAIAALVCSTRVGVTDLHVGIIKASTRPDHVDTLVEITLTVAVHDMPELAPVNLEGKCAHRVQEVAALMLAALRAEDPAPTEDETGINYRRWLAALDHVPTTPIATPYR